MQKNKKQKRITLTTLSASIEMLTKAMTKNFESVNNRFDEHGRLINQLGTDLENLAVLTSNNFGQVYQRLDVLDQDLKNLERRLVVVEN